MIIWVESVSCPVLSNSFQPHGLQPTSLSPWNSPGKNTRVGGHYLLQGIFPTQGWNPDLHCRQFLYGLSQQGSPLHVYGGGGGGLIAKSCLTLATPWTIACQAPLSIGFSRQEYWSGLPFPSPFMYIVLTILKGWFLFVFECSKIL